MLGTTAEDVKLLRVLRVGAAPALGVTDNVAITRFAAACNSGSLCEAKSVTIGLSTVAFDATSLAFAVLTTKVRLSDSSAIVNDDGYPVASPFADALGALAARRKATTRYDRTLTIHPASCDDNEVNDSARCARSCAIERCKVPCDRIDSNAWMAAIRTDVEGSCVMSVQSEKGALEVDAADRRGMTGLSVFLAG